MIRKKLMSSLMAGTMSVLSVCSCVSASSTTDYYITKRSGETGNPSTTVSIAAVKGYNTYNFVVSNLSTSNNECLILTGGDGTTVGKNIQRTSTGASGYFSAYSTDIVSRFNLTLTHSGSAYSNVFARGYIYMK